MERGKEREEEKGEGREEERIMGGRKGGGRERRGEVRFCGPFSVNVISKATTY